MVPFPPLPATALLVTDNPTVDAPPPPPPELKIIVALLLPPLFPCDEITEGVLPTPPFPDAFEAPPPPPEPPANPSLASALPPPPPPLEVIVEKIELVPLDPLVVAKVSFACGPPTPPPPTVIAYVDPGVTRNADATRNPPAPPRHRVRGG